jgi:hypothetical protein
MGARFESRAQVSHSKVQPLVGPIHSLSVWGSSHTGSGDS